MVSLDNLLAKLLVPIIYQNLGDETIQKIKNRLLEKNYSLFEALKEFDPFDKTLREFFGKEADEILLKIFDSVFEMKRNRRGYPKLFLIKDEKFTNMILSTFSDEEKRAILAAVSESALPVSDMLKKVNLTQSTGYRIVGSLIKEGLLIETDKLKSTERKKVSMYKSTVSFLDIRIKKSIIEIEIPLTNEIIKSSRMIGAIMSLFGRPDQIKNILHD
jgi:hypothetical protein